MVKGYCEKVNGSTEYFPPFLCGDGDGRIGSGHIGDAPEVVVMLAMLVILWGGVC